MMVLLLWITVGYEGFQLEPDSREVKKWETFLTHTRAEQTRVALAAARSYVPILKPIFKEEGVPEDLIWLAFIESSFRPDATSPTGARGMFQFKRKTARAFGLKIGRGVDERLVPHLSARASARYLRYLYEKFGSWDLVLAAYNLGEGDLRRAMKRHNKTDWPGIRPLVREETRNYVGKIKAAALIGNRHLAEAPANGAAEALTRRADHLVRKGETLYAIARRYKVDLLQLKRLNGISGNTIYPGQRLRLPVAKAEETF